MQEDLRYEPYKEREYYMTEKEVHAIEHLTYEDGSKIQGVDIQRVFNLCTMVPNMTIKNSWKQILTGDAMRKQEAKAAEMCGLDKDDCEACGS